jgi:sporadic carbohydrate cluster 2OG-Fe(II) oxygenase
MAFLTEQERALTAAFLRDGYVIAPADDRASLDANRALIAGAAAAFLGTSYEDEETFLNTIAERIDGTQLNALRLHVIDAIAADPDFRARYFACTRSIVETLVGNELAMQRGVGLSVQLPGDDGSLLPLHSDAWSEDSPFELVVWTPLVDCYRTKSMFLAGPQVDAAWRDRMSEFAHEGAEAFFRAIEPEVSWLEIPYGHVLVFTHTLMHGNRVNREPTARWSLNVRFKALFTPYSDKQLGDFFDPITLRAATRIGMQYRLPAGFDE